MDLAMKQLGLPLGTRRIIYYPGNFLQSDTTWVPKINIQWL